LIKPSRTGSFLGCPVSVAGYKSRKAGGTASIRYSLEQWEKRGSVIERRKKLDRNIDSDQRINIDRRFDDGGILRFIVSRRDRISGDIVDMRPGEEAELIGPLGNFWPLDDILPDFFKGNHVAGPVALVGGGIGIASLLMIAPALENKSYDFYAGFRTGSFGLEGLNPKALIVATEDGSAGVKGNILDFFIPKGYSRVFTSGPKPMMRAVANLCIAGGIPSFVSAEKHITCGVGVCRGCNVRTTGGRRRCCTDGPIFSGEEIIFDE